LNKKDQDPIGGMNRSGLFYCDKVKGVQVDGLGFIDFKWAEKVE